MKKTILFGLMLLASLSFVSFAQYTSGQPVSGSSLVGLTISNTTLYIPYPAEPGKYIDLWVRVQYTGTVGSAEGVECKVDPSFPFSIEAGDPSINNLGNLAPFQEVVLKYRIRVDANAVPGTNKLKYACKMKGFDYSYVDLPIYIQAQDAILSVERIESNPVTFEQGQKGSVSITLKNIANVLLKDITVKYDLSSADIPFAPVNSTIEKRIASLEPGESAAVQFAIATSPDAADKLYKIPLTLTYFDALGKNYTRSTISSLQVQTKPDVFIVYEPTATIKNGTTNTVTISFVNRGASQLKFLTASLAESPTGDYEILTPADVYVGDINSDDSETATYELFIKNPGALALPVTITFRDISGNSYTQGSSVAVSVLSSEEAVRLGIEKVVSADPLIMIIGAAIVLYILYRIFKAVTKKKQ